MAKLLKKELRYKRKFINTCIMRIRFGHRKARTIQGYKTFIFKSMKSIVEKNIFNYLNLLNGTPCRQLPEYDEILSECWIVFDKCLEKFKVSKYNNFYFYFNKALARNFYRCYNRELKAEQTELTEEIVTVVPVCHTSEHHYTECTIYDVLNFTPLERKICDSKMRGEKSTEFLKKNKKVTKRQYDKALIHIKELLQQIRQEQ